VPQAGQPMRMRCSHCRPTVAGAPCLSFRTSRSISKHVSHST
jgi:hypothetical protein